MENVSANSTVAAAFYTALVHSTHILRNVGNNLRQKAHKN